MKTFRLLICALFISSQALAAGDLGVGLMIGHPTGVTAKKILANGQALDAGAAWSVGGNTHFQIHSDWLFNKQDALYWNDQDPMDIYAGVGARMKFANDIELGVRVPVGLAYYMHDRRLELFSELAPIVDLLPETDLELHLLLGIRYYL